MRRVRKSEKIILIIYLIAIVLLVPFAIYNIVETQSIKGQFPFIGIILFMIVYSIAIIYRMKKEDKQYNA
ncbi:hypothetical protein J40TS1_43140 [Paenibacillus montaniterrae]|uniref:Uncharacterized protein n=1 Tax=Paenibacillus montaniterrae TaxID=429341 RepID=A0A919YT24_9BACL|nr:hypothetical protein J40TS1_43140 [Paenibacillus montaniterrae]